SRQSETGNLGEGVSSLEGARPRFLRPQSSALRTLRKLEQCLNSERTDSANDARIMMEPSHTPDDNNDLQPDRPPQAPVEGEKQKAPRRPRGFAAMDRKLVSEIARKGGK